MVLQAPITLAEESASDSLVGNGRFFALPVELDLDSSASNGLSPVMIREKMLAS